MSQPERNGQSSTSLFHGTTYPRTSSSSTFIRWLVFCRCVVFLVSMVTAILHVPLIEHAPITLANCPAENPCAYPPTVMVTCRPQIVSVGERLLSCVLPPSWGIRRLVPRLGPPTELYTTEPPISLLSMCPPLYMPTPVKGRMRRAFSLCQFFGSWLLC